MHRKMIKNINILDKTFDIVLHDFDELLSEIIRDKGIYSKNDLIIMKDIIKEGDIFIDIGANIGWHTFFGSTLVGNSGRVHAFEPTSLNFNLLEQGVNINKFKNITINKLAISNKICELEIVHSPNNCGDNIICDKSELDKFSFHYKNNEKVNCSTLDDYIDANNIDVKKIKLIKMDIQGSEANALEGMKKLIEKHKPYFILEFSPNHLKLCNSSSFDILSFIDKNNYILYHLREEFNLPYDQMLYRARIVEIISALEEIISRQHLVGFDIFLSPACLS